MPNRPGNGAGKKHHLSQTLLEALHEAQQIWLNLQKQLTGIIRQGVRAEPGRLGIHIENGPQETVRIIPVRKQAKPDVIYVSSRTKYP